MFDYFYGQSGEMFSYFRVPKILFRDIKFKDLSTDAKTLYGILLDRMGLSVKNGWLDEQGRVYIIFPVQEVMLDYFNDREATLFRDELGSNARYHELLQKKLAAEDAHRKMVGEAAWKQYLQLDEICNELESVRYQAMYLAGAADFEKLFRQS